MMAVVAAAFSAVFVAGGATVAQAAIVGAVTGAVVGGIKAAVSGENILKGAVVGGVIGGVGGALAGWASGAATSVPAAEGGTTMLPTAAETAANNAVTEAAKNGVITMGSGADIGGKTLGQISPNTAGTTGQSIAPSADVLGNFPGQSVSPNIFTPIQHQTSVQPLLSASSPAITTAKASFLDSPYAMYGGSQLLGSVVEGIGGQQEKDAEIQALKDAQDQRYSRINNVSPAAIRSSMPTYGIA